MPFHVRSVQRHGVPSLEPLSHPRLRCSSSLREPCDCSLLLCDVASTSMIQCVDYYSQKCGVGSDCIMKQIQTDETLDRSLARAIIKRSSSSPDPRALSWRRSRSGVWLLKASRQYMFEAGQWTTPRKCARWAGCHGGLLQERKAERVELESTSIAHRRQRRNMQRGIREIVNRSATNNSPALLDYTYSQPVIGIRCVGTTWIEHVSALLEVNLRHGSHSYCPLSQPL